MMMLGASLIAPTPLVMSSIRKVVATFLGALLPALFELDAGLPELLAVVFWLVAGKAVAL